MSDVFSHPAQVIFVIGLVLAAVDIVAIGVSPIMFVAAGGIVSGLLIYLAEWEVSLLTALTFWAACSAVIALVGIRPLRAFQNSHPKEDSSSDLIGREVVTTHDVTKSSGTIEWSGTLWQARL